MPGSRRRSGFSPLSARQRTDPPRKPAPVGENRDLPGDWNHVVRHVPSVTEARTVATL
jgi:hypothetical protein